MSNKNLYEKIEKLTKRVTFGGALGIFLAVFWGTILVTFLFTKRLPGGAAMIASSLTVNVYIALALVPGLFKKKPEDPPVP